MASNADRAERWIERAMGWNDRDLGQNGTVYYEGDTIFSYGSHFPMATVMRERPNETRGWRFNSSPTEGEPRWILLNGDRYSVTTSGHQGLARGAADRSGLPTIIVPFTALNAAGIERTSIEILEVREDRIEEWTTEPESEPQGQSFLIWNAETREHEPDPNQRWMKGDRGQFAQRYSAEDPWEVIHRQHFLGDSLFIARSNGRRRRFLSSFDYQEAQPLYFLCELPRTSKAMTVEQAYEDLKPELVKDAEGAGLEVTRQGDMFAVPTALKTREVKLLTPHRKGRIVKRPRRGLLGTNHTASEVIFATKGRVYARGILYHEPGDFRPPDHARKKMGDGKTWHLLEKNTVPRAQPRTREAV